MKLVKFIIKNFRGYKEQEVQFTDFTTFVGINDAGKSTILEALDIFFKNSKIERSDRQINSTEDVELTAYFSDLPSSIVLETVPTTFDEEYLTLKDSDSNEYFVLKQKYSGESLKLSEFIVSTFPTDESVKDIHTLKINELKKNFSDIIPHVDKRVSTEIRKVALKSAAESGKLDTIEISINNKGALKDISSAIYSNLPIYQLFKADRSNNDGDSEIQDPINAIIKVSLAQQHIQQQLESVSKDIESSVKNITDTTVNMLQDMNPSIASDLDANFKTPNWSSVFKFSLDTNSGIPLNKRGSGVRRLILLNFFRSEAKRKLDDAEKGNAHNLDIIYAFEEPETAQHPKFQKMLIDSFKTISESKQIQVFITTHSPSIVQIVPKDGIRLIKKDNNDINILSNQEAISGVIDQLGILPNIKLYPDQIECAVFVEGTTDIEFFEYIYNMLSTKTDVEKEKTIFVSGGGTSIVDAVNLKFVEQLRLKKKIMIVDGDDSGKKDIARLDENDDVTTIQLQRSTIEFYLPYNDVKQAFSDRPQIHFSTTEEEWTSGEDQYKLTGKQKSVIKKLGLYSKFNFENLRQDIKTELSKIINLIDRD
ncbi:AAA family ATPase [Leuconostoc pseudomesenteroides]|uniref:ATP-binding protein n=1 Tax=Leuconostoc pseudomesenteroides TaxID=33968 RepID=UPI00345EED57